MGLPEKKTRDPLTLGSSEKLVHYIQWWIRFNAALSRSLRLTSQLGLEWDAADQAKQFKLWDVQPALEQGDCTDWWGLLWLNTIKKNCVQSSQWHKATWKCAPCIGWCCWESDSYPWGD